MTLREKERRVEEEAQRSADDRALKQSRRNGRSVGAGVEGLEALHLRVEIEKEEYKERRPHSSLGYQTPAVYARQLAASSRLRATQPYAGPQQANLPNANFVCSALRIRGADQSLRYPGFERDTLNSNCDKGS